MTLRVYVYVATSADDLTKRVLINGTPCTLEQLRSPEPFVAEVTEVDVVLGASQASLQSTVQQIAGVASVEMLAKPSADGVNPLNADFHVTRTQRGKWEIIMAGVQNAITRLVGEDYDVVLEDFRYHDDSPPAA